MPGTRGSSKPVARLLLAWQSTADERTFAQLFDAIGPVVERVARHVLRSAGIADPGAIDDAATLVFDHLRRLPGPREGERAVERFRPVLPDEAGDADEHEQAANQGRGDPGLAFVRWLATERARDIARARRRLTRHAKVFSQLDTDDAHMVQRLAAQEHAAGESVADEIRRAVGALDHRSRRVVELLLEGESQAAIALHMGVCEGTVSRIRVRAIEKLRTELGAPSGGNRARRPPK